MGEVPRAESAIAIAVFATVYLGTLAGRFPRLALDRTGIALLGAIVLVATGVSSLERATAAIDAPTILLLFGLMGVSAQLRLGGFYARTAHGLAALALRPVALLALLVAVVGVLLLSRRLHSRATLGLFDWQLLVLFIGLFVVNDALQHTGLPADTVAALRARGIDAEQPGWLFAAAVLPSNAVSNVPAVMLLLPVATHPLSGTVLALASTCAGNLRIVGSIANMIVIDAA